MKYYISDLFQARRVSSQSEELNLEDELLLDDGDDDDLLRSDPEEDELSLMPENDGNILLYFHVIITNFRSYF